MVQLEDLVYKSYCWCFGTTSFRTKNFNRKIEEQLLLLKNFFDLPQNTTQTWENNNNLQEQYYLYMQEKGFVSGDAQRKDKDARQKTSGLVDLGLVDSNRKLTQAGISLLELSLSGNFASDNFLKIPKDSFIYLKQILKTSITIETDTVRPIIVLLHLLSEFDYLSVDEFTYLLPLCTNAENTNYIKEQIRLLRQNQKTIDEIIISVLNSKDNYQKALEYLLENEVTDEVICNVGINRKSHKYDMPYALLYRKLHSVFLDNEQQQIVELLKAIRAIKIGKWWRSYLFDTSNEKAIKDNPEEHINNNVFQNCKSENDFKKEFFKIMHLFKAKATLSDYFDLNRRYLKMTDVVLFEDSLIKLDIVPKQFFNSAIGQLYQDAYVSCSLLHSDCNLEAISQSLIYNEQQIIANLNADLGESVTTIEEAYSIVDSKRYERFENLIESKFSDENLLALLDKFVVREDDAINAMVTENADIPTIFEYVLGIIWYKASNRQGKILDYLKLSLDADLLPVTHAAGGEADIVYEYSRTDSYPEHTLLLEATLADSTNQRRMEMEPVSRHLGNHILATRNLSSYCVFATNNLHINVISDFRGRKNLIYCNTQNPDDYIEGMKIVPLETSDLRSIILQGKKYPELYRRFETAYNSNEVHPKRWYDNFVKID